MTTLSKLCTHSFAFSQNIQTDDNCFTSHPIASISDPRTGVASVGYDLWTGIECKFTVYYRIDEDPSYQTATCTIQSKHAHLCFCFVPTQLC